MKKITTTIIVLFLFLSGFSQKDSVDVLFAYRITDYMVKLNDSVTIVQVSLPDAWPATIKEKQMGLLKHRYENGTLDTTVVGWGRCNLIKGDYYYFTIARKTEQVPKQGDLLYTTCKTPAYYKSPLYEINRHGINLTDVYESQFYHSMEIFSMSAQKEKLILDSMVSDVRFTGKEMKKQMPGNNQTVSGGMFDGKKVFDVMETTSKDQLLEFLKYMVARPQNYAGNTWKVSEIYATWIVSKAPQVISN